MGKVRVAGFSMSVDGFGAGSHQSLADPIGQGGLQVFQWFFRTKTWCDMHGKGGGKVGADNDFAARAMDNYGAFILGRNMFGPVRGPWTDDSWKGRGEPLLAGIDLVKLGFGVESHTQTDHAMHVVLARS
jgi:hypothetical protein